MLVQKSTLHLAKGMVGIAISAMLAGALLICLTSWNVPGWMIVSYSILVLYLAHHISAAPCLDEPDLNAIGTPNNTKPNYQEKPEELTAEALAKSHI